MSLRSHLVALLLAFPAFAADRPNVLIICGDDHAPYVMGAYGNTRVRTPNLDRLASQGMRFDRAYCNSPVCTASRQSLLTGRYPSTIGVTQLATALPASETTLAEMLASAGYRTGALGKMHFNSELRHGFEFRLDLEDHSKWLGETGARPLEANTPALGPWRPFRDPAGVWLNSACLPYPARDPDMSGTWFAGKAAEFIEDADAPFFLMVSFYEPHSPFHFPFELARRHNASEFSAPPVPAADAWQIPAVFKDLTDEEKRGIAAAYYTSVEYLDKNVGLVLDALDRSPLRDDTLVIYIGDYGYMLSQHGRFEKHCSFEPAVRAPLLVRFPGRVAEGATSEAFVEFVDLAPTILEFCGVSRPSAVQGRSLVPLLTGRAREHRDHVVVEYAENEEAMIRNDRYKLVYTTGNRAREDGYLPDPPNTQRRIMLYDELNDPNEFEDLADRPEHKDFVAALLNTLAAHMKSIARQPELVPVTDDPYAILGHCLQPRDVGK